jgi:hypothetical protein
VWTALPGVVKKFDAAKMTCEIEPTIQALVRSADGSSAWVTIPVLVDCPVVFPSGGGFTLTFPVKPGDEALVIFASRCIDAWWQSGGVQPQADLRLHDLSDGFALIGPRSQPRVLSPAGSTGGVELRNDARTAYVRIDDSANVVVHTSANATVTAAGEVDVTAPAINLTGAVKVTGTLEVTGLSTLANVAQVGTLTSNTKVIGSTHTHGGVQTGSGTTGAPT